LRFYFQVHRDDGFELDEYSDDAKKVVSDDIENLAHSTTGTAVRLPGAVTGTAVWDDTSMHSRASIDAK
jgi:hypothetical protein